MHHLQFQYLMVILIMFLPLFQVLLHQRQLTVNAQLQPHQLVQSAVVSHMA